MASAKSVRSFARAIILVLSVIATMPSMIIRPTNAAQTFTVTIADFAFNPQSLAIHTGDTVNWINNDQVIYTLWFVKVVDRTPYKPAGTDGVSDPILPDSSWSETFNEPVELQYYSLQRLDITGYITITSPSVGGFVAPVDKLGLLTPYFGLASTILAATVATLLCVKRAKRRDHEQ